MDNIFSKIVPVLEPQTQAFLKKLASQGTPPIYELPVEDARGVLLAVQDVDVEKMPADIEDHIIPIGPDQEIGIRIVRPMGSKEALPVIMYFHGGGWVLGDKITHDRLIREIACGTDSALVFVDYTRSPEAQYPTAIEEGYAATKWIAHFGGTLNLDTSRIAIAGDSAGGTLATAIAMIAKESGGPRIDIQVLFYPVTDAGMDTKSFKQFGEGFWLAKKAMKWFWDNYAPDEDARSIATAAPLQASIDQLKGMPPALIITSECDILRDEGEAYARKLIQAEVPVTATRYIGTIHDFVLQNAITNTPATRAAIAQACGAIRKAFG